MTTTTVRNLATGKIHTFFNDLSAKENLISAYMIENKMNSCLLNKEMRKKISNNVELCNGRTLNIDNLAVIK